MIPITVPDSNNNVIEDKSSLDFLIKCVQIFSFLTISKRDCVQNICFDLSQNIGCQKVFSKETTRGRGT